MTDGVVEFAAEHKKWAMILNKVSAAVRLLVSLVPCVCADCLCLLCAAQYGEFFQDRTVVDLKDKWRNLKSQTTQQTQRARGPIALCLLPSRDCLLCAACAGKLGAVSKSKGKGNKRKADADAGEVEEIED